jgi:hypothetical protein
MYNQHEAIVLEYPYQWIQCLIKCGSHFCLHKDIPLHKTNVQATILHIIFVAVLVIIIMHSSWNFEGGATLKWRNESIGLLMQVKEGQEWRSISHPKALSLYLRTFFNTLYHCACQQECRVNFLRSLVILRWVHDR